MKNLRTVKYVDKVTGGVTYETQEYHTKGEPAFFKSYIQDISKLHSLSKTATSVLIEIASMMNYDNKVILVKTEKLEIASKIGVSIYSVDKAVKELYKAGFILKVKEDRARYTVNPTFFAKGVWRDIYKLKLSIHYSKEGSFILTEYELSEDN